MGTDAKGYDWGGFLVTDPLNEQPPLSPSAFGKQLLAVDDASGALTLLGISALAIPDPTGQGGNFLTTDGVNLSWSPAAGGGGTWGSITGTLSSQSDLNTALGNKQPLDADLTAIAALTTTSFGRSFLDRADAAAGRTLLGLGTLATQNGTFSGTSSGTNTGDQDLSGLVPTTRTVNGHALSSNVTVTTGDLGATTVGAAMFGLTNPSAITFPRFNADNSVSALSASAFRTAIGAGTSSFSSLFTGLDFTSSNLTSIATRNFSDLQNKPTTVAGYGITDAEQVIPLRTNAAKLSLTSIPVGTETRISDGFIVSGLSVDFNPINNGLYIEQGSLNGKPIYYRPRITADDFYNTQARFEWSGTEWLFVHSDTGVICSSTENVAHPWEVTRWEMGEDEQFIPRLAYPAVQHLTPPAGVPIDSTIAFIYGAGDNAYNGIYIRGQNGTGTYNGKPYYLRLGVNQSDPSNGTGIFWITSGTWNPGGGSYGGGAWQIVTSLAGDITYASHDDVSFPWNVTTWVTTDAGTDPIPSTSSLAQGELDAGITVSGAGTANANDVYYVTDHANGKNVYTGVVHGLLLQWNGSAWKINNTNPSSSNDTKIPSEATFNDSASVARNDIASEANWISNYNTQLESVANLSFKGNRLRFLRVNSAESSFEIADVTGDDTAYNATSWNGNTGVATKNAIRDKFETLRIGSDVQAYDADLTTWAGITPGTGVGTALGVNVGTSGAFITNPAPVAQGGTNLTSYAIGDLLYASGATTLSKLADVATGSALISGGLTTAPSWGKITTSHTTGIAASGANTDITSLSSSFPLTTPKITTGINDANANSMLAFTATASAVDGFTFTNAATANPATVTMAATGSDSNINITLTPKGTGVISTVAGITSAQGTIAANTPALTITQTWNNSGVSFIPFTITATDTASTGVATGFLNFKVGSNSEFSVNKNGIVVANTGFGVGSSVGSPTGVYLISDRVYNSGSGGTIQLGSSGLTNTVILDGTINKSNTAFGQKAYTVATLPSTSGAGKVTGATAAVTDGDSSLAWGATVVNSGSGATSYLVWYNGSNWTVMGK